MSNRYARDDPNNPLQLLQSDVGTVLKAASKQLSDKSPKTRMGMFTVLKTLVGVLPGSVADHVGMLVPGRGQKDVERGKYHLHCKHFLGLSYC